MLKLSTAGRVLPPTFVSGILAASFLATGGVQVIASLTGYGYNWGGILSSAPAVDAVFTENVFVNGQDSSVYYRTIDPAAETSMGWAFLGGREIADPGAATVAGTSYVFIQGQDNALWWRTIAGSWATQGGVLSGGAGADTGSVAGQIKVFVRGQDNATYYKTFTPPSTWSANWTRLGGVILNRPQAASAAVGDELLVVRGQDNAAYIMHGNGATFDNVYHRLGGVFTVGLAASSCSAGHYDVWGVGQDNALWSSGSTDGGLTWSPWVSWGGVWTTDMTAQCRPSSTTVDVYGRGKDFALWQYTVTGS